VIRGGGTPENDWLNWPALATLPHRSLRDWVPAGSRLVVVAPHPDDEVLMCGGLLQMQAAAGGEVLVVAVTDGEGSHPGSRRWRPRTLAHARRVESAQGLERLAAAATCRRLAVPDGAVAAHVDQVEAELRQVLRAEDRVVTTWRQDGHPDHEATALATARACQASGSVSWEAPVWMWHWAEPGDARIPWERLAALELAPTARVCKRLALAKHLTQLVPRDTGDGPVLGPAIVSRAERPAEYFFV
jgi:LmbE family N-acetylglucosaminyl deacetylase